LHTHRDHALPHKKIKRRCARADMTSAAPQKKSSRKLYTILAMLLLSGALAPDNTPNTAKNNYRACTAAAVSRNA